MSNYHSKVLILVPANTAKGGIASYYYSLKSYLPDNIVYFLRGARHWPNRNLLFLELIRFIIDFFKFRNRLKKGDIKLIQTSTSLGIFPVIRDGIFIYYANIIGIKTIVFFRGWNKSFEKKIEKYFLSLFKYVFFRADKIIVLSSNFKMKLVQWGYSKNIVIETTTYNEKLLKGFNFEKHLVQKRNRLSNSTFSILFLARVEIKKGIYEAINTFNILYNNNKHLDLTFIIAGSGNELSKVKQYIMKNLYANIRFVGHVEGKNKINTLLDSDLLLFPSYSEGMPNGILEAMAFGLPIVARSVGAIPEIIKNGENGFHTKSKDPSKLAKLIQQIIDNPKLMENMSKNNYLSANERYSTSKVAKRLQKIFHETI